MDAKKIFLCFALLLGIFSSCNQAKRGIYLNESPVVAEKVMVGGEEVIVLNPALLKDTVIFPLSHFVEDIEILKLDDREEALIYPSPVEISDNYILVKSGMSQQGDYYSRVRIPCKLFDKKGNFISDIGAIGQGAGEYQLIYAMQLDEKNQRVYLMPWQTNSILVYDLQGNVLDPIPLPYRSNKGVFKVEGDRVTVAVLPFPAVPLVAWVQNLQGEVLHEIPRGHLEMDFDFSNEIESSQNTAAMDLSFWFWPTRQDSLYHIDAEKGRLIPRFTCTFEKDKLEPHSYGEWTNHFVGNTSTIVHVTGPDGHKTEGKTPAYYIVDKETLRGSYFRIENDILGGEAIEWPLGVFNKGYYALNMDPGNLEEWIETLLKGDKLSEKMRARLTQIQETIDPEDNNYILYAKVKK
ncbi:6-bladed beta-propeller [Parabacteroides sp. OttesenSCG-928-O15]|nr:6-bladed beta-propeller [Parabacteroides sp. OttesenSCG-928-O15]